MNTAIRSWATFMCALQLIACAEPPATDQAGAEGPIERWTVEPEPIVTIGTVDGPPEAQLFESHSAQLLSDGTIVIANSGTFELRFHDEQGRFVRSAGTEGDGPGEFRSLTSVWRMRGDTIVVWDSALKRLSFFTSAGDFVSTDTNAEPSRQMMMAGAAPPVSLRGTLDDGSVVALSDIVIQRQLVAMGATPVKEGQYRAEMAVVVIPREPDQPDAPTRTPAFDTVGVFPGEGKAVAFAIGPERVAVGEVEPSRITVLDRTGAVHAVIERNAGSRVANSGFRFDRAGNLWVREFSAAESAGMFDVFAPDGRRIARAELHRSLPILDLTPDFLLTRARGPLDVEEIRLYRIRHSSR